MNVSPSSSGGLSDIIWNNDHFTFFLDAFPPACIYGSSWNSIRCNVLFSRFGIPARWTAALILNSEGRAETADWNWVWQNRPVTVTSSNLLNHHSQNTSAHLWGFSPCKFESIQIAKICFKNLDIVVNIFQFLQVCVPNLHSTALHRSRVSFWVGISWFNLQHWGAF